MVGPFTVDPVVLLASSIFALLVPCAAVYLLAVDHTRRRMRERDEAEDRHRADVEDRLARLEGAVTSGNGLPEDREEPPRTVLRDPQPPASPPDEQAPTPTAARAPPEVAEAGADDDDPWMRAFSGHLRGREVLDRQPLPDRSPREAAEEDDES